MALTLTAYAQGMKRKDEFQCFVVDLKGITDCGFIPSKVTGSSCARVGIDRVCRLPRFDHFADREHYKYKLRIDSCIVITYTVCSVPPDERWPARRFRVARKNLDGVRCAIATECKKYGISAARAHLRTVR